MHGYPLRKVTVGLRQFVQSETETVNVAQRLKRMDRVVDKLARFPTMRLSQMEDVGGCRAVVQDADEVQRVARRMRRRWDIVATHDYRDEPKPSGYRALHYVVRRDGRLIEIQLRTVTQQVWAEAVETWSARTGFNLKDQEGPEELLEFFRLAARGIALDEAGEPADEALEREFERLRGRVGRYLVRR